MEEKILICEDMLEGVFAAIYEVYAGHYAKESVRIQVREDENYRLFAEYIKVETDCAKAVKVMRTLREKFGEDAYKDLCLALTTEDSEKAQAVYRTVELGLRMSREKRGVRIMDHLTEGNVRKVMELSRAANNELMHLRGFLRFQELSNGILYAKIGPRDNILSLLAPHFADRLSGENFLIYDHKRNQVVVHPAGEDWYMVQGINQSMQDNLERIGADYSYAEKEYQELFQFFCNKISIKERENKDLQRSMLPLRFQKYMTEFMPK